MIDTLGGIIPLVANPDLDSHRRIGPASSDGPSEFARVGIDHVDEVANLLPYFRLPVEVDHFIDRNFLNARFLALFPECRLHDNGVGETSQGRPIQLPHLLDALEQNGFLDGDSHSEEESMIARLLLFLLLGISLCRSFCCRLHSRRGRRKLSAMGEKHCHFLHGFDALRSKKIHHSSNVGLANIMCRSKKTSIVALFDAPLDEVKAEVRQR